MGDEAKKAARVGPLEKEEALDGRRGSDQAKKGFDGGRRAGEWYAVFGAEESEERPRSARGEDEADEEEDGAKNFVPLQVHEDEDHEHELHDGEHDEGAHGEPFRKGQVDDDDFHAGDKTEGHGELDEDEKFARLVCAVHRRRGVAGVGDGRCGHGGGVRDIRRGKRR